MKIQHDKRKSKKLTIIEYFLKFIENLD